MTSPDLNSEDPSFLKRGIRQHVALLDVREGTENEMTSPNLKSSDKRWGSFLSRLISEGKHLLWGGTTRNLL